MTDVAVREGTAADIDAVRRVAERSWTVAYDDVLSGETIDRALAEWYDADALREWTERDEWPFFVATTADGSVVGYVAGDLDGTEDEATERVVAILGAIYVDPDHWCEGIGAGLLDAFELACSEGGREVVRLRVLTDNERALSFYCGNGYAVVDECEAELFGESAAECVLERSLD